jgi:hypothetical protein
VEQFRQVPCRSFPSGIAMLTSIQPAALANTLFVGHVQASQAQASQAYVGHRAKHHFRKVVTGFRKKRCDIKDAKQAFVGLSTNACLA